MKSRSPPDAGKSRAECGSKRTACSPAENPGSRLSDYEPGKGYTVAFPQKGENNGIGSEYHRHAGSNGACSDPSKVFKGKHMPGHMGSEQVTVQNLEIVRVDTENNLLLVKGAVPGPKKSLVTIKETVKSL